MANFDQKFLASISAKLKSYSENEVGFSKKLYKEIEKCDVEDIESCEELYDFIESEIKSCSEFIYVNPKNYNIKNMNIYKNIVLDIKEMFFLELKTVSSVVYDELIKSREQNESLSKPRRHLDNSSSSSSFFVVESVPAPLSGEEATASINEIPTPKENEEEMAELPTKNPSKERSKKMGCCVIS